MEQKKLSKTKIFSRKTCLAFVLVTGIIGVAGLYLLGRIYLGGRNRMVINFLRNPELHPDYRVEALTRCGEAPFLFPSDGFIGYLWDDSFKLFNRHQGLIFLQEQQPVKRLSMPLTMALSLAKTVGNPASSSAFRKIRWIQTAKSGST